MPVGSADTPKPMPLVEIIPEIIENPIPEPITINETVPEPTPVIIEEKIPTELEKIILSHESAAIPKAEKVTFPEIEIRIGHIRPWEAVLFRLRHCHRNYHFEQSGKIVFRLDLRHLNHGAHCIQLDGKTFLQG